MYLCVSFHLEPLLLSTLASQRFGELDRALCKLETATLCQVWLPPSANLAATLAEGGSQVEAKFAEGGTPSVSKNSATAKLPLPYAKLGLYGTVCVCPIPRTYTCHFLLTAHSPFGRLGLSEAVPPSGSAPVLPLILS